MPLILEEEEVKAMKGLLTKSRLLLSKGIQRSVIEKLLSVLEENPDCTRWIIMTQKEYDEWTKK